MSADIDEWGPMTQSNIYIFRILCEAVQKSRNQNVALGSGTPLIDISRHCSREGDPKIRLFLTSDQRLPRYRVFKFHKVPFPTGFAIPVHGWLHGAWAERRTGFARCLHWICPGSARGLHGVRTAAHWVCTGSARGSHGVRTVAHWVCTGFARGSHGIFFTRVV